MIVPNKCALCKKQWYIHIYIIYIFTLLYRSKSNDMKLKHTLPSTAPYAQTKAQTDTNREQEESELCRGSEPKTAGLTYVSSFHPLTYQKHQQSPFKSLKKP